MTFKLWTKQWVVCTIGLHFIHSPSTGTKTFSSRSTYLVIPQKISPAQGRYLFYSQQSSTVSKIFFHSTHWLGFTHACSSCHTILVTASNVFSWKFLYLIVPSPSKHPCIPGLATQARKSGVKQMPTVAVHELRLVWANLSYLSVHPLVSHTDWFVRCL